MIVKQIIVDRVPDKCADCVFQGKKKFKCKLTKDKYGIRHTFCPLITEDDYNASSLE